VTSGLPLGVGGGAGPALGGGDAGVTSAIEEGSRSPMPASDPDKYGAVTDLTSGYDVDSEEDGLPREFRQ